MTLLWMRLKDLIVHRILHLDDTPHRIAWGVFLGLLIGWTPTLGFQIVLYLLVATLLRANTASGIPAVFISNPFTAVPLYYFAWKVGNFVLHVGDLPPADRRSVIRDRLRDVSAESGLWVRLWTAEFWRDLGQTLLDMGAGLWLGSLLLGIVTGAIGYAVTYWGVKAYRQHKMHISAKPHVS